MSVAVEVFLAVMLVVGGLFGLVDVYKRQMFTTIVSTARMRSGRVGALPMRQMFNSSATAKHPRAKFRARASIT